MRPGEQTLRLLLEPLVGIGLDDPETTEVAINRPCEAWVEARGEFVRHDVPELTCDHLLAVATLAAAYTGQDVDQTRPLCATMLPNGQRVQICLSPAVAPGTVSLSIRRPGSSIRALNTLSLSAGSQPGRVDDDVLARLYASGNMAQFFRAAVLARKNILICGRTGSGKTSLALSLISEIPLQERLVTIEDTPEWVNLPHQNRVALYYSKGDQGMAKVRSEDLLECSLRARPDRVLMQELRDGAAFVFLRSVVAGHPGAITTCHADSAAGAFDALRLMVRQHPAGATLADKDVLALLHSMIDVVIHCEREGARFWVSEVIYGGRECALAA